MYTDDSLHGVCFPTVYLKIEKGDDPVFSSPEPKAHGELIVYQSSRRPCVRPLTLSTMNISETSGPIATKFYLKHHWSGGKAALDFEQDRIGTLVSIAPIGL